MAEKRRRFSPEFKREAVRLAYSEGRSVSQVAKELDLRTDILRRRLAELGGERSRSAPSADEREIRRLAARAVGRRGGPGKESFGNLLGAAPSVRFAAVARLVGQLQVAAGLPVARRFAQRIPPLEPIDAEPAPPGRSRRACSRLPTPNAVAAA